MQSTIYILTQNNVKSKEAAPYPKTGGANQPEVSAIAILVLNLRHWAMKVRVGTRSTIKTQQDPEGAAHESRASDRYT
jgi:hypothetical protein